MSTVDSSVIVKTLEAAGAVNRGEHGGKRKGTTRFQLDSRSTKVPKGKVPDSMARRIFGDLYGPHPDKWPAGIVDFCKEHRIAGLSEKKPANGNGRDPHAAENGNGGVKAAEPTVIVLDKAQRLEQQEAWAKAHPQLPAGKGFAWLLQWATGKEPKPPSLGMQELAAAAKTVVTAVPPAAVVAKAPPPVTVRAAAEPKAAAAAPLPGNGRAAATHATAPSPAKNGAGKSDSPFAVLANHPARGVAPATAAPRAAAPQPPKAAAAAVSPSPLLAKGLPPIFKTLHENGFESVQDLTNAMNKLAQIEVKGDKFEKFAVTVAEVEAALKNSANALGANPDNRNNPNLLHYRVLQAVNDRRTDGTKKTELSDTELFNVKRTSTLGWPDVTRLPENAGRFMHGSLLQALDTRSNRHIQTIEQLATHCGLSVQEIRDLIAQPQNAYTAVNNQAVATETLSKLAASLHTSTQALLAVSRWERAWEATHDGQKALERDEPVHILKKEPATHVPRDVKVRDGAAGASTRLKARAGLGDVYIGKVVSPGRDQAAAAPLPSAALAEAAAREATAVTRSAAPALARLPDGKVRSGELLEPPPPPSSVTDPPRRQEARPVSTLVATSTADGLGHKAVLAIVEAYQGALGPTEYRMLQRAEGVNYKGKRESLFDISANWPTLMDEERVGFIVEGAKKKLLAASKAAGVDLPIEQILTMLAAFEQDSESGLLDPNASDIEIWRALNLAHRPQAIEAARKGILGRLASLVSLGGAKKQQPSP